MCWHMAFAFGKKVRSAYLECSHSTDHLGRTHFTWHVEAQKFLSITWSDENGFFPNAIPFSSSRPLELPHNPLDSQCWNWIDPAPLSPSPPPQGLSAAWLNFPLVVQMRCWINARGQGANRESIEESINRYCFICEILGIHGYSGGRFRGLPLSTD
jgi:hypothetical protein